MDNFKNIQLNPEQYAEPGTDDKLVLDIKIVMGDVIGDHTRGMAMAVINDKYVFPLRATPVLMPGTDMGVPSSMLIEAGFAATPLSKIATLDDGKHGFFQQADEKAINPFQYDTYLREIVLRAVVETIVNRLTTIEQDMADAPEAFANLEPFTLAYEYNVIGDMDELTHEAASGGAMAHFGVADAPKGMAALTITELYSFIDYEVPDGRTLN